VRQRMRRRLRPKPGGDFTSSRRNHARTAADVAASGDQFRRLGDDLTGKKRGGDRGDRGGFIGGVACSRG
jgi:hypothetical protein